MTIKYPIASVHGRFQPPHLDHLEYIVAGFALADRLVIGITQPSIETLSQCPEDPHRSETLANPYTFAERCDLIRQMLKAVGILESRFSFIQFPIEDPQALRDAIDTKIPCLTTIRDQWNITKIERLQSLGYTVEVLWDRRGKDGIQGTEIRKLVRSNDDNWRKYLHSSVVEHLVATGLIKKMYCT
jgi:nicotinamide mononucleotide adenylyltransferase